jgi:hypothetical protein
MSDGYGATAGGAGRVHVVGHALPFAWSTLLGDDVQRRDAMTSRLDDDTPDTVGASPPDGACLVTILAGTVP